MRKVALVTVCLALTAAFAVAEPGYVVREIVLRNTVLLVGLALGCLAAAGRPFSLLVVTLAPAFMWIVGSQGTDIPPASWAILLYPNSSVATAVALGSLIVGGAAYVVRSEPMFASVAPQGR